MPFGPQAAACRIRYFPGARRRRQPSRPASAPMRTWVLRFSLVAAWLGAASGCHSLASREPTDALRQQRSAAAYRAHPVTVGSLVLHADFALPQEHRMLTELVAEHELICSRLNIQPSQEPIHVYLFGDEEAYRRHVSRKFPGFPERRAIFVETDVELCVYAHWGEAIAEDLRHEVAHGYLHAAVPNLPLWLDEGLAEYFEVGRGRRGVNRLHVEYLNGQLAVGGWSPDLRRLEQLTAAAEMTQLDYAEAWLWVHYLLEGPDDRAALITDHLAQLRGGATPAPISQRLAGVAPDAAARAIGHLKSLASAD
jgi:hypothetical protein